MPTFATQTTKRGHQARCAGLQKAKFNAKIAQLVEHDLAKVGVAGSSPVFRSASIFHNICNSEDHRDRDAANVRMAELVDALL